MKVKRNPLDLAIWAAGRLSRYMAELNLYFAGSADEILEQLKKERAKREGV